MENINDVQGPAHLYTNALNGAMLELGGKSKSEQKDDYLRDEVSAQQSSIGSPVSPKVPVEGA